ncbi:MAG: VWA domain-containing protein [Desulfobacterales bacterium]|nr:VWA domain-containing protein [Desulfobacterales bacterium]
MKTIPFTAINQLKFLSRMLLCVLVISGITACGGGGGGGGGGEGEYSLTGYSGVDPTDTENPYDLYTTFPWWVNFTFQVKNPDCEGVSGLSAGDFRVTEDGTELTPANTEMNVRQRHNLPSDYTYTFDTVLLLDNTPSQTGNLDLIKEAAQAVIDSLDEKRQQRVAIVAFDDNGDPFVKQEFTDDLSELNQCLITGEASEQNPDALQLATGTTDLYGAVIQGLSLWDDDTSPTGKDFRQGALVAVTDGKDTSNLNTLKDALLKRGRKPVYTVAVDSENIAENILADLEKLGSTGGFFPVAEPAREADEGYDKKENLSETLQEIQNRLLCFADGFYWLRYKSPSTSEDDNLNHTVNVSIIDNKNEGEGTELHGKFSSAEFFTGQEGVYLDASSSDPDGLDEISITVEPGQKDVTKDLKAVTIAEDKESASQFEWTSSDESVFTVASSGSSNSTGIITAKSGGQATLTVKDTATNQQTDVTVKIVINMESYEIIKRSTDSTAPWFADAAFQVRLKEDGDAINNQWTWVRDLIREDFSVYENGQLVNPEDAEINIRKRDAMPTDFTYTLKTVLLIDNTPSVGSSNLAYMKDAAKAYVENAFKIDPMLDADDEPQQEIAVWTFTEAGDPTVWQEFSTDPQELTDAIDRIRTGSGVTSFYAAMSDALNSWQSDYNIWQPANNNLQQGVLVALTDGYDSRAPGPSKDLVISERGQKQVITIGVGDDLISRVNVDELKEISNAGFYSVPDPGEETVIGKTKDGKNITQNALNFTLAMAHFQIVDYANSFYWLEYKSGVDPALDCSVRDTMKITIKNNANTSASGFLQGKFKSCEFVRLIPGKIYINPTAANPEGITITDTVELQITTLSGTDEIIGGDPSYDIQAITHQPADTPNYTWDVVEGNNIVVDVHENRYANYRATVRVNPDDRAEGPARVEINDTANNNPNPTQLKFFVNKVEISPIAYYPFNGNADDKSGNAYHGEVQGATLTADRFGNSNSAYQFDGNDDYIALNMFYGPDDGTSSWAGETIDETTVCAWVKSSSKNEQFIASFDRSDYWRLALKDTPAYGHNLGWDTAINQGEYDLFGTSGDYTDGKWHYICATYSSGVDGDNKKIYVDGEEVASTRANDAKPLGSGAVRYGFIGVGSEASKFDGAKMVPGSQWWNTLFKGTIDDVMIFHEELSSEEIRSLSQISQ